MEQKEAKIKSLEKAMNVLGCFSTSRPELGITDIAQELGLYKSTVHNIVTTLECCGFLEQNKTNGKYRLGLRIMELSHVLSTSMGFHNVVNRCLKELVKAIDEIVYFGIPSGDEVMYIDGAFPDKMYNTRWVQGMTAPMSCTAIGKAMLAFMGDHVIDSVLEKPIERFTDFTITDPDRMREELRLIRARGYSIDDMEHEYGVKCVGVPVFNLAGEVAGALSATGPSLRFTEERVVQFAALLREKAQVIQHSF